MSFKRINIEDEEEEEERWKTIAREGKGRKTSEIQALNGINAMQF